MVAAWLSERVAGTRQTVVLACGDAAAIALFVALGELRHAGTVAAGLVTLGQFGVAWLVVGTAAGVYAEDALSTPQRAVVFGVAAWIVAALVGQLLRLLLTPGSLLQPTFVLVTVGVGGLFVGAWRFVAAQVLA